MSPTSCQVSEKLLERFPRMSRNTRTNERTNERTDGRTDGRRRFYRTLRFSTGDQKTRSADHLYPPTPNKAKQKSSETLEYHFRFSERCLLISTAALWRAKSKCRHNKNILSASIQLNSSTRLKTFEVFSIIFQDVSILFLCCVTFWYPYFF